MMDYAEKAKLLGIDRGRLGKDQGFEIPNSYLTQENETFFREFGAERPEPPAEDLSRLNPSQSAKSANDVKKFWRTLPKARRQEIISKRRSNTPKRKNENR